MYRAAIIYAPDGSEVAKVADQIKEAFNAAKFSVSTKVAAHASIPDLAAADLAVFVSKAQGKSAIHPDFSEIIRSLEGVNLAGRVAGVFSVGSEATLSAFKKILKDSEIGLGEENLFLANSTRIDKKQIRDWLERLSAQVEEMNHGR